MRKNLSLALLAIVSLLGCQSAMTATAPEALNRNVTWFDGQQQRTAWISEREFVEFGGGEVAQKRSAVRQIEPAATVVKEVAGGRVWRTALARAALRSLQTKNSTARLSPVFHPSRQGGPRMALTGDIVIRFKADWSAEQISRWADQRGLKLLKPVLERRNIYLFQSGPGLAALEQANEIQRSGEVEYATPQWWQEVFLR